MAKPPEKPSKTGKKVRDYARPTRAKAHRPEAPEADPALDALLAAATRQAFGYAGNDQLTAAADNSEAWGRGGNR